MKNLLVVACLFLMMSASTTSKTPFHTEAIDINMNGDLLITNSNDPDDPMKAIHVYNLAGQLVASKACLSGTTCTHDLSNLAPATYLAVANSKYLQYSENVLVK